MIDGLVYGTSYGLAGLGDLIPTCPSTLSRNHYVGYELAKGRSLPEISASMPHVAEGVTTTAAAHQLLKNQGLTNYQPYLWDSF